MPAAPSAPTVTLRRLPTIAPTYLRFDIAPFVPDGLNALIGRPMGEAVRDSLEFSRVALEVFMDDTVRLDLHVEEHQFTTSSFWRGMLEPLLLDIGRERFRRQVHLFAGATPNHLGRADLLL